MKGKTLSHESVEFFLFFHSVKKKCKHDSCGHSNMVNRLKLTWTNLNCILSVPLSQNTKTESKFKMQMLTRQKWKIVMQQLHLNIEKVKKENNEQWQRTELPCKQGTQSLILIYINPSILFLNSSIFQTNKHTRQCTKQKGFHKLHYVTCKLVTPHTIPGFWKKFWFFLCIGLSWNEFLLLFSSTKTNRAVNTLWNW